MAKIAKRKLNAYHKVHLFNHAVTKFTYPEHRKAEADSAAVFVDAFMAEYNEKVLPNVPFLMSISHQANDTPRERVSVHSGIPVLIEGKDFTLGDGTHVKRGSYWKIEEIPRNTRLVTRSITNVRNFISDQLDGPAYYYLENHKEGSFALPSGVYYPDGLRIDFLHQGKSTTFPSYSLNGNRCGWLSEKTVKLAVASLQISKNREIAERELWRGIGSVILAAQTMEELIEFWPEAVEIEDKLGFGPKERDFALVSINDETKSRLCQNMSDRGVNSSACKVAA